MSSERHYTEAAASATNSSVGSRDYVCLNANYVGQATDSYNLSFARGSSTALLDRPSDVFKELECLGQNWNDCDAEPPSNWSIAIARRVAEFAADLCLADFRVSPSADGGVSVSIHRGSRYASLVITNDQEILATTSVSGEKPTVDSIGSEASVLQQTLEQFVVFFGE